ncbi:MAG: hypothetical protein ACK5KR_00500 [Breznakia sp.]
MRKAEPPSSPPQVLELHYLHGSRGHATTRNPSMQNSLLNNLSFAQDFIQSSSINTNTFDKAALFLM